MANNNSKCYYSLPNQICFNGKYIYVRWYTLISVYTLSRLPTGAFLELTILINTRLNISMSSNKP